MAGTSPGHKMLALVLHPRKKHGRQHPLTHHDGEEILYVLRGDVSLQLAGRTELLSAGDCAHFNAAVPHKITSLGEADAQVLLVIAGDASA